MLGQGRSFSGHERHCAYLNTGNAGGLSGRFANVSAVSGFDFPDDGRGLAVVDWDHDGDLDLWVSNRNAPRLRFLRNESPHTNHSVSVRLLGTGKSTNRDAIGARVQVVTDTQSPLVQVKTLHAGEGFLSQNSKWLHFGLGATSQIEKVIVRWPGGEAEEFSDLAADRRYILTQGSGQAREVTTAPRDLALTPEEQTLPARSGTATLRLMVPLEMPPLQYHSSNGERQSIQATAGQQPVLVNLWATWCMPCVKELNEFSELRQDIKKAGLQVLALSVDGLGSDESNASRAAEHLKKMAFPFPSGHATSKLLDQLQAIHDLQTPIHHTLPLPSSFLFDAQGRLAVIYKGPVTVEQVLEDVSHTSATRDEGFRRAAAIEGRVIQHDVALNSLKKAETVQRTKLASWLRQNGFKNESTAQYAKLVDLWPESSSAHLDFGTALLHQGLLDLAKVQLEKSLEIDPLAINARTSLGHLLMRQRRYAASREHYEVALQQSPDDVRVLNNLGTIYGELGDFAQALEHFKKATEMKPDDVGGHNNLGWLLATCSDAAYQDATKAIASAEQACKLSGWKDYSTLDTLATAHAAAGRFSSAARWATQALELAPSDAKQEIHRHLQLYQAGIPYRPPSNGDQ